METNKNKCTLRPVLSDT